MQVDELNVLARRNNLTVEEAEQHLADIALHLTLSGDGRLKCPLCGQHFKYLLPFKLHLTRNLCRGGRASHG